MINFMEAQGYKISDNILFQDNQSAIKLEENGKRSSTGNTRHVNITYFYVKDLVDKKQVRVLYCPTGLMLADFFTKPLQGKLFNFFSNIVMGYVSSHDAIVVNPEMKERIVNLGNYQENIISRMGLNDDMGVRTYEDPKEKKSKDQMDDDKDKNDVVQVRKEVPSSKADNRTYAAIPRTGNADKFQKTNK